VHNFLKPSSSNNAPSANFVSAKNLLSPCPPSRKIALHPSNPDRQVWLDSYKEEKGGLQDLEVFERINKKTYLSLRRKGLIPKALPSMCVLVVKHDKDGKPDRAKSRIVVLGNFEERMYSKSDRYSPILKYSSLRLLTAKQSETNASSNRQTAKMHFAMLTFLKTRKWPSAHRLGILATTKMNFGYLKRRSTD